MSSVNSSGSKMTVTAESAWEAEVDAASKFPEGTESKTSRTPEQFQAVMNKFADSYDALLDQLAKEVVPERDRDTFREQTKAHYHEIVFEAFGDACVAAGTKGAISEPMARKAILQANLGAQKSLIELRAAFARPDMRPQVVAFTGTDGISKVALIKKAPQLETLVLQGGGAKGIGNPPALVELDKHMGLLNGLNHIVGTSAGAMTAVCLASGLDAKSFQELSDSIDMNKLKDEFWGRRSFYRDMELTSISKMDKLPTEKLGGPAGQALYIMDKATADSVSKYLKENLGSTQELPKKLATMPQEERDRINELYNQSYEVGPYGVAPPRGKQMVTFKDLQILHRLEPSKFKELTLTGFDHDNKETVYFNAANTPNMPVAYAARISMSIPVVFKSVKYDPGDGKGQRTFVDGGVGNNVPTEPVLGDKAGRNLGLTRASTLLMCFDQGGQGHMILHGPEEKRYEVGKPVSVKEKAAEAAEFRFADNPKYRDVLNADKDKIYSGGPNTFMVFHGNIGTLDLDATKEQKDFATLLSQMKSLEQINARQNQAYHEVFPSVDDAFKTLSHAEINQIRQGGEPKPEQFKGLDDPQFMAAKALYNLATGPAFRPLSLAEILLEE
jgi:predicted acylesterase/phospholipase RssA